MTKATNTITIPKLISAMKEAGFPTKKDVKVIVKDVVFNELSEFHAGITKPEMQQMEGRLNEKIEHVEHKLDTRIDGLETKVDKLTLEVDGVKDDVRGLKGEFALTPSRNDFEKLKRSLSLS